MLSKCKVAALVNVETFGDRGNKSQSAMQVLDLKPIISPGGGGGGGGGNSHLKGAGMLVISLRGVNLRFWSRLGCSWQNVIIFSRQGLV